MRRLIIVLALILTTAEANSQFPRRLRHPAQRSTLAGEQYHNLGVTWQTIDLAGKQTLLFSPVLQGVSLTSGHSFMIHEMPLWRLFHIGFDITWLDFEAARWRRKIDGNSKWMRKFDAGIGAGPALHISPGGRSAMHFYWRYNPTYSLVMHNFAGDEDGKFELVQGLVSYFSAGIAISWDTFSVGGEWRGGGGKFRGVKIPDITLSLDDPGLVDELLGLNVKDALDKQRHTMRGWRLYISFRF